ncbi:MAG TPA: hypothetical protein VM936_04315 [Pyrinomonadaceae bacterium]|nr:hypothetical protein [Pyrinomonadaceae bacterium]
MRSSLFPALAALACLLAAAGARAANTSDVKDGKPQVVVALQSGAHVRIRTESDPPGGWEAPSNFVEAGEKPNLVRRVFVDSKDELFFGYELLVERAGAKQFLVAVRPLSREYLKQLTARPAFRKRRLHPSYNPSAFMTAPQAFGDGDTFALDVLRNPRTGAKIVDVIQVSLSDAASEESATDEPRDFALEDIQLQVKNYELLIDGESVYKSPGGSLSGPLVWLALRDRGRFVFSLVPRAGYDFRKTAKLEGNKISFEWDGERFEWVSSEAVVGLGGNWNLWVLHDADYSFDLFDQTPARNAPSDPTFARQTDEAVRNAQKRNSQAGFGSNNSNGQQQPAPKRRTRVIIGAANSVSDLFPK